MVLPWLNASSVTAAVTVAGRPHDLLAVRLGSCGVASRANAINQSANSRVQFAIGERNGHWMTSPSGTTVMARSAFSRSTLASAFSSCYRRRPRSRSNGPGGSVQGGSGRTEKTAVNPLRHRLVGART
jgi:hypothetical protein